MAADYAGALDAIRSKFIAGWTSTPLANVGYPNESDPVQADGNGDPAPWAEFEIVSAGSFKSTVGTPGNGVVIYDGLIKVHVFTPKGTGVGTAVQFAVAAGEIFRNQKFYDNVTDGCYVRSGYDMNGQPRIEQGEADDQDGVWFAVTATVPFEYWHRA